MAIKSETEDAVRITIISASLIRLDLLPCHGLLIFNNIFIPITMKIHYKNHYTYNKYL